MSAAADRELIVAAASALNPQQVGRAFIADVGCALLSATGKIYTGASVGTFLGLCAEQGAVSAMVSIEPPKIAAIVAVWRDDAGQVNVLPPCGRCREMLRELSQDNLRARILLGQDHAVELRDLLPYHGWHAEPVHDG